MYLHVVAESFFVYSKKKRALRKHGEGASRTKENCKSITPKMVTVTCKGVRLKGFDLKNSGIVERWLLMGIGHQW